VIGGFFYGVEFLVIQGGGIFGIPGVVESLVFLGWNLWQSWGEIFGNPSHFIWIRLSLARFAKVNLNNSKLRGNLCQTLILSCIYTFMGKD